MRIFLLLLQFVVPIPAMLVLAESDTVVRTTALWEWVRVILGALGTFVVIYVAWPELGESRRERIKLGVAFYLICFGINYVVMGELASRFMTRAAVETVDVLEQGRRSTAYTKKGGATGYHVCDHHIVFRMPDSRIESLCLDLKPQRQRLAVPGKAALHLRKSWAGRVYLGVYPLPPLGKPSLR